MFVLPVFFVPDESYWNARVKKSNLSTVATYYAV